MKGYLWIVHLIHPDQRNLGEENYVVSFEGEITVEAETEVKAENQGYDLLCHSGQITVVAFKKQQEKVRQDLHLRGGK